MAGERTPRTRPIFGTDLTQSPDELVEGVRLGLASLRGRLRDIGYEWSGFLEQLANVEGLLTCGIHVLYDIKQEMHRVSSPPPSPANPSEAAPAVCLCGHPYDQHGGKGYSGCWEDDCHCETFRPASPGGPG